MHNDQLHRELIDGARAGSKADLEALLRSVQDRVYTLCVRMLRDPQNARDATQEVLIRIATRLDTFRHESAFLTWVYRVTANHLLNVRRQESEWPAVDFEKAAGQLDAALEATRGRALVEDPVLVNQVGVFCTQGMLLCLDRDLRLAYILGEILELSGEEAANVLDIEHEAFRKRLSRARALLYSFLRARCGLIEPANDCRCEKLVEYVADPSRFPLLDASTNKKHRLPTVPGEAQLRADVDQLRIAAETFRRLSPTRGGEDFLAAIRSAIGAGF